MKHLHRKDYHDHLFMLEENNEELITYAQWCEMQNIRHKRRLPMGEETDKAQRMITLLLCCIGFMFVLILTMYMKQQQQLRTMGVPMQLKDIPCRYVDDCYAPQGSPLDLEEQKHRGSHQLPAFYAEFYT